MATKNKKLDKEIERLYYQHCTGTAINIMNIGKLYNDCRTAHANGQDLEQAVIDAIKRYAEQV
jgi:hypothetical protein